MKRGKWIAATIALALGLSAGAFADNHPRDEGRRDGRATYTQRDGRGCAQTRNNGYYGNGYRDNDDYRDGNWYSRERDRDFRSRDRDRGGAHGRRDQRDRDHDRR